MVLLLCANLGFSYLNLFGISKFENERKNYKDCGRSSKMTTSSKWLDYNSLFLLWFQLRVCASSQLYCTDIYQLSTIVNYIIIFFTWH